MRYLWHTVSIFRDIENLWESNPKEWQDRFNDLYQGYREGEIDDDTFLDAVIEEDEKDLPPNEGLIYIFEDRDYSDAFVIVKVIKQEK